MDHKKTLRNQYDTYAIGYNVVAMILRIKLKEAVISSVVLHVALCLLIIASAGNNSGLKRELKKGLSVDIAKIDRITAAPASLGPQPGDKSVEPVFASTEVVRTEPAVKQDENHAIITDTEQKVESLPYREMEFTTIQSYHHFILYHKQIYSQQAASKVNELIGEALKTNKREFYGGTAFVHLAFGPDGHIDDVKVVSTSEELKAFLEEIDWTSMPAPIQYYLDHRKAVLEFAVLDGFMNFRVTPI